MKMTIWKMSRMVVGEGRAKLASMYDYLPSKLWFLNLKIVGKRCLETEGLSKLLKYLYLLNVDICYGPGTFEGTQTASLLPLDISRDGLLRTHQRSVLYRPECRVVGLHGSCGSLNSSDQYCWAISFITFLNSEF